MHGLQMQDIKSIHSESALAAGLPVFCGKDSSRGPNLHEKWACYGGLIGKTFEKWLFILTSQTSSRGGLSRELENTKKSNWTRGLKNALEEARNYYENHVSLIEKK